MTDYLEEHLERSGALLEQVRRMEQSLPGPPVEGEPEGSAGGSDPLGAERGAAELVSESEREVDGLKEKVDRLEKAVDNAGLNEEFPEEQAGATGDWQNGGETAAQGFQEGPGADHPEHAGAAAVQTNQEKAEPGGVPLLEQLEEELPDLCRRIDLTGLLTEEDREELLALSRRFLASWQAAGKRGG